MRTGIFALSLLLGAAPLVAAQYDEDCDTDTAPPNQQLNVPGGAPLSVASNLRTYSVEPLHRGRKPWPTVRPKGNARPTALPYGGEISYGSGASNSAPGGSQASGGYQAPGAYAVADIGADVGGDQPAEAYGQGNRNQVGSGCFMLGIGAGGGYDQSTAAAGEHEASGCYPGAATEVTGSSDAGPANVNSATSATEAVAYSAPDSQSPATRAPGGYASPATEAGADEGGYATSRALSSASEASLGYSSSSIEAAGLSTSQTAAVSDTGATGAYSVPTAQAYSGPSFEATGGYAVSSSGSFRGSAGYTSPVAATGAADTVQRYSSSNAVTSSRITGTTGTAGYAAPSVQAAATASISDSARSIRSSFSASAESGGYPTATGVSEAITQHTTASAPGGYAVVSGKPAGAASASAAGHASGSFATLSVSVASNGTGNYRAAGAVPPVAYSAITTTIVAGRRTMTTTVYLASQSPSAATAAVSAGYSVMTRRPHGKSGPKQICSCRYEQ